MKTIANSIKLKAFFLQKINTIDKSVARMIIRKKKKRQKTQTNEIRSEKEEVTTDSTEIQKIMKILEKNYMSIK